MKLKWDEGKNQTNLIKHGFDFTDAYRIFNLPMVLELDERENYGEDRFVAIGLLHGRSEALRQKVRQRAENRCEYCLSHQDYIMGRLFLIPQK